MNLLCIYGPPAAGKLTTAKELETLLGYKLYDNHAIVSPLGKLFLHGREVECLDRNPGQRSG